MRFPKKLSLLICGCVLLLAGLCLIQYRLVRNTYSLERATYFKQVERQLELKTQALSDSLNQQGMRVLLNMLQYQLENNIEPGLKGFQQEINLDRGNYRHLISETLRKDSLLRDIDYSFKYTRIVLYHDGQTDTLLRPESEPLLLAGKGNGTFLLSAGKQGAGFNSRNRNSGIQKIYRVAVWNVPMINAAHWQRTVLKRMVVTLAGSVALIAALILVFFLIFSALLTQKRIAEVTTDFANNMMHELKTPLSAAALVVKSLRTPDAKLDQDWFEELLEQLDRQHGKIGRLMNSVMTTAMDKPVIAAQLRPLSLTKLLEDLTMLATAAERELLICGQTELMICTDPDMLTAILSNLLDNALKYTPKESSLTLTILKPAEKTIMLSLEDEGPGIEKKYERYLFQKFFRVPRTNDTGQIKGLGLGLYLCRMQAGQLNAKLTYVRNDKGGSTFNLILPHAENTDTAC